MSDDLKANIARQRHALYIMLIESMSHLAARCAAVWPDRARLDEELIRDLGIVPHCRYLYALDENGVQVTDNIAEESIIEKDFGRDRSARPYWTEPMPENGLLLSQAYISLRAKRPSLTALRRIEKNGVVLGYLGADFDLRNLPLTRELYREPTQWKQLRGDPAIRGSLFHQSRAESLMDRHIDSVMAVIEELIVESGVFHSKIHFSSSRTTLWLKSDPYRYRILGYDELSDPDICLAYPHTPYPDDAEMPQNAVRPVLEGFKRLRFADDIIYLRAGSLNIYNGMISLNFSCDGSHYLRFDEFLSESSPFWKSM